MGAALVAETAEAREPRFCPFCGAEGTLTPCEGAGFVEKGCYLGDDSYCYEGSLPGRVCSDCKGVFSLDLDDDAIHDECACERDSACDCGRYAARFHVAAVSA